MTSTHGQVYPTEKSLDGIYTQSIISQRKHSITTSTQSPSSRITMSSNKGSSAFMNIIHLHRTSFFNLIQQNELLLFFIFIIKTKEKIIAENFPKYIQNDCHPVGPLVIRETDSCVEESRNRSNSSSNRKYSRCKLSHVAVKYKVSPSALVMFIVARSLWCIYPAPTGRDSICGIISLSFARLGGTGTSASSTLFFDQRLSP